MLIHLVAKPQNDVTRRGFVKNLFHEVHNSTITKDENWLLNERLKGINVDFFKSMSTRNSSLLRRYFLQLRADLQYGTPFDLSLTDFSEDLIRLADRKNRIRRRQNLFLCDQRDELFQHLD